LPSILLPDLGSAFECNRYFHSIDSASHFGRSPAMGGAQDCPSRVQPHVYSPVDAGGVVLVLVDTLVAGVLVAIGLVGDGGEFGRTGGGFFFFFICPS
jgi:hypothetical protein